MQQCYILHAFKWARRWRKMAATWIRCITTNHQRISKAVSYSKDLHRMCLYRPHLFLRRFFPTCICVIIAMPWQITSIFLRFAALFLCDCTAALTFSRLTLTLPTQSCWPCRAMQFDGKSLSFGPPCFTEPSVLLCLASELPLITILQWRMTNWMAAARSKIKCEWICVAELQFEVFLRRLTYLFSLVTRLSAFILYWDVFACVAKGMALCWGEDMCSFISSL